MDQGNRGGKTLAVLRRLDCNVWDAWLQPSHMEGLILRKSPAIRLMRNGVSYEKALTGGLPGHG